MTNDNDEKLRVLSEKLDQINDNNSSQQSEKKEAKNSALGAGFRVGIELAAGVAVGCGLGLLIDYYFGTSPWGLIVLFFMGSAAGFLNVYRAIGNMGYKVGYDKNEQTENDNVNDNSEDTNHGKSN